MELIFGLGSGRCGTTSLAALLNRQPDVCCFHELAPSVMAWEGAEATVGSLLRDFGAIGEGGPRWVTADRVVPERETGLARLGALEQVTVDGLLSIALQRNPTLRQSQAHITAETGRAIQGLASAVSVVHRPFAFPFVIVSFAPRVNFWTLFTQHKRCAQHANHGKHKKM